MILFKKADTVFFKLIVSFAALNIIIIMILGVALYIGFSSVYKGEVEKVNQKIMDNIQKNIENSVFKRVETIYIDLSAQKQKNSDMFYLYDNYVSGNHSKILSVYDYLISILNYNEDLIDSIYVYIPYNNIILSAPSGIKYINDPGIASDKNADWFKKVELPPITGVWHDTIMKSTNSDADVLTYLRAYPIFINSSINKGCIAFNINERFLYNIISELSPDIRENSFIINSSGKVISHVNKEMINTDLKETTHVKRILSTTETNGSFMDKINGLPSVVSFTALGNSGWKLVNYSSVELYYKKSSIVQRMWIISCILTLIVGFILSNIFTTSIYNPLKGLIIVVKSIFGDKKPDARRRGNEYVLINNVINELSFKINDLQTILKENRQLIRYNFIDFVLNGRIHTMNEFADHTKLLNISIKFNYYTSIIIELDESRIRETSIQNRQLAIFGAIKEIENMSNENTIFLAAELLHHRICIIVNSKEKEDKIPLVFIEHICLYIYSNFVFESVGVVGRWVENPLELHYSYKEAQILLKYKYFYTERIILPDSKIIERETSNEQISPSYSDKLTIALNTRDMDNVNKVLEAFVNLAKYGNYSSEQCWEKLHRFIDILTNYAKGMNFNGKYNDDNLNLILTNTKNIDEFKLDYLESVSEIFNFLEKYKNNRNVEFIEKIKNYISDHITDECSLDSLSSIIGFNPKYLSKIFKEVTGVNFVDYVNSKRLEKAKELLLGSQLTLEEICSRIGYNTTGYFIRQFKKAYGDSPISYKRNHYS